MPFDIGEIINSGINAVKDVGIGSWIGSINDSRQRNQEEALQNIHNRGAKEIGMFNLQNAIDLWKKTGIMGEIEQIRKSGMNPAMLYAKGGIGGTTSGGNAGSGGNQGSPSGGQEIMQAIGMDINAKNAQTQQRLAEAQTKVMESQANLNNVEADKKAGVETENIKANTAAIDIKKELDKISLKINDWTWLDQVNEITSRAIEQQEKGLIAGVEKEVAVETRNEQIEKIQNEVAIQGIQKRLMESNIKLNDATIQKMAADIVNKIRELNISQGHLDIAKAQQEFENDWGTIVGKEALNAVGGLIKVLPFAKVFSQNKPPKVQGFGGKRSY